MAERNTEKLFYSVQRMRYMAPAIPRRLFEIFLLLFLSKLFVLLFVNDFWIEPDPLLYAERARALWERHSLWLAEGLPKTYPLYSVLLAPAFALGDRMLVLKGMLAISSLLSSAIVFPAYLIARRLGVEKAIFAALTVGLLPSSFNYAFALMAESVYLPLFLLSAWLVAVALERDDLRSHLLAGVSLALAYLAKPLALAAVLGALATLAWNCYRKKRLLDGRWLIPAIPLLTVIAWDALLMVATGEASAYSKTSQFLSALSLAVSDVSRMLELAVFLGNEFVFLLLASGIVLLPCALLLPFTRAGRRNAPLLLFTLFSGAAMLFFSALHAFAAPLAGEPYRSVFGRYEEAAVPLLVLLGLAGLYALAEARRNAGRLMFYLPFAASVIAIALFTPTVGVDMIHNMSAFIFYALASASSPLLLALAAAVLFATLLSIPMVRSRFPELLLAFLIISSMLISIIEIGASHQPAYKFAAWLHDNDPGTSRVVLDRNDYDYRYPSGELLAMRYWTNDEIVVGDVDENADYVISSRFLPYQQVFRWDGHALYRK